MAYMFDRDSEAEWSRLAAQARLLDPGTIRHLRGMGIREGAAVAEIGGGGGTIAAWMCRAVGPSGRVTATDLDVRQLGHLEFANLRVVRHDVFRERLPSDAFDLIHARLLLFHLRDGMEGALANMVQALKPGGTLLVEEYEMAGRNICDPGNPLQRKVGKAIVAVLESIGVEPNLGRRLWGLLEAKGLGDVGAEGRIPIEKPPSEAYAGLLESQRGRLLSAGGLSQDEFERALAEVRGGFDGTFYWPAVIAAWGRRM